MPKVMSLDELKTLSGQFRSQVDLREKGEKIDEMIVLKVGMGASGIEAGARKIMACLVKEINDRAVEDVVVIHSDCVEGCELEPLVELTVPGKEAVIYSKVTEEEVKQIVEKVITLKA